MQCREAQTFLNDEAGGGKKVQFLDRHFVECELGMHACILVTPHTLFLPESLRGRLQRCGTITSAAAFRVWPQLRKTSRISQLAALSTR